MKSVITLLACCAMVASATGAVLLQSSYKLGAVGGAPSDLGGGTFGYEIATTTFDTTGSTKLVFVYSSKDSPGSIAGAPVTAVTYNGSTLSSAINVTDDGKRGTASIFYLDGSSFSSNGTIRIELGDSVQTEYAFGLYALSGLKTGVQSTDEGGTDNDGVSTVTMTTSSGFTVQETVRNNQSLAASTVGYTTLYNYSSGTYRGLSQYQITSLSGNYSAATGNTGAGGLSVGAAFEAIPEPSTALLVGLGLLMALRRRR